MDVNILRRFADTDDYWLTNFVRSVSRKRYVAGEGHRAHCTENTLPMLGFTTFNNSVYITSPATCLLPIASPLLPLAYCHLPTFFLGTFVSINTA